jgi:hypothetical protein
MITKLSMQIFVSTVSDINKAIGQNYRA